MTQFSTQSTQSIKAAVDTLRSTPAKLGYLTKTMTQRTETEQNGNLFGLDLFRCQSTLKLKSCCAGFKIGFRG